MRFAEFRAEQNSFDASTTWNRRNEKEARQEFRFCIRGRIALRACIIARLGRMWISIRILHCCISMIAACRCMACVGRAPLGILEAKSDSVLAQLDWKRPEMVALFPFPHRVQMAANVTSDSLGLQTTVFADAGSAVPISFGLHPYFGISGFPRAQWRLQLPGMRKLLLDARGIPTGGEELFGPVDGLLGDTSYDDGFALLSERSSFSISGAKHNITVAFLEGFAYAQVFAPKDKDFVALEPMTAPTSALTSGKGLRVTEPGHEFRASFRIKMGAAT